MDKFEIYDDIKTRTNGDIYIGVVGPVRVGKSTFISNFMKKLVLPNIESKSTKERTIDELPQSADGKTVMTTQPHFVPNEAVKISVAGGVELKVRMIDCVGYLVSEAMGVSEDGAPRLVKTPWSEQEMSFEKAATLGTQKVISEHSTIAVMVTTDGSVTDIARDNYVPAEEKVIKQLQESGKPYVVVLNCKNPTNNESKKLASMLSEKYGVPVIPINALELGDKDVDKLFENILSQFPLKSIRIKMPKWLNALHFTNPVISEIVNEMKTFAGRVEKIGDATNQNIVFAESEVFDPITFTNVSMGDGIVTFSVVPKDGLFYNVLSNECGLDIKDDFSLISIIKDLAVAKTEYDKIKTALDEVNETGYGIVAPKQEEFELSEPELVKQGSKFGVKIRATAPSLHLIKVDVNTEITPMVGTEPQCSDLVNFLQEKFEDKEALWDTNLLGKSLSSLVSDNINLKINFMPLDAQKKMRKTLTRIVNEGKGGVICILL